MIGGHMPAPPLPACPSAADDAGRHPLHVGHDQRSQGRRPDARATSRPNARGAFEIVRVDEHDAILGVLPLFHALAQMANLLLPFSIGARVVFLETVNSTELLRALAERQRHDLRVRAAVLLPDPPARDGRGRPRRASSCARRLRAACWR